MYHRKLLRLCLATLLGLSTTMAWAAPNQPADTSRRLYDRVMEEFKHRDYDAALAGFRFFLELHGRSSLASNAQYWMGECHYRMGRYKEALAAFTTMVAHYPTSQKIAATTLKMGQTYEKMGDQDNARLMYERVLSQYPYTPESEQARKSLDATTVADQSTAFAR